MCVEQAYHIVNEEVAEKEQIWSNPVFPAENFKPRKLKLPGSICYWSRRSQKCLSVAVYNHYKRLRQNRKDEVEIEKSILFLLERQAQEKL